MAQIMSCLSETERMWEDNTSSVHTVCAHTHKHLSYYCFRTMTQRQVVWPHLEIVFLIDLFTYSSVLDTEVFATVKIRKDIAMFNQIIWSMWGKQWEQIDIYDPNGFLILRVHINIKTCIRQTVAIKHCWNISCVEVGPFLCLYLLLWQP